jgi:hypothetical protein
VAWLAGRLGVTLATIQENLAVLLATSQVSRQRRRYVPVQVLAVSTGHAPELARQLKAEWVRTALGRLEQGAPGHFGYSLFAVSRADLGVLRDLHVEYVRAMQQVISRSSPSDCVGLFCAQLLDLASMGNTLAAQPAGRA